MSPIEFKAWFEGFSEGIEGRPTEKQWTKVKERVAQITPTATPYPIFVDRYVPTYPHWNWPCWTWNTSSCGAIQPTFNGVVTSIAQNFAGAAVLQPNLNNCTTYEIGMSVQMETPALFAELGRTDYAEVH